MNRTLTVVSLLVVLCFAADAQTKDGRVSGMVLDVNDARVAGAKVTIEAPNFTRELSTTSEGEFNVNLRTGTYSLTVDANGFCKFQRDALRIASGTTEMLNTPGSLGLRQRRRLQMHVTTASRSWRAPPNKSLDARRDSSFLKMIY